MKQTDDLIWRICCFPWFARDLGGKDDCSISPYSLAGGDLTLSCSVSCWDKGEQIWQHWVRHSLQQGTYSLLQLLPTTSLLLTHTACMEWELQNMLLWLTLQDGRWKSSFIKHTQMLASTTCATKTRTSYSISQQSRSLVQQYPVL